MKTASIQTGRRAVVALLALGMAIAAMAQDRAAKAPQSDPAPFSASLVKTGLYLISGGGANTLLRFSANGLILVDGKLPGNYPGLMSQVTKINKLSDLPLRVLIVTDHHDNHTGNDAQFLAAGVAIIAQQHVASRLSAPPPAASGPLPPVITFDKDYTLRLGGVEVQLLHFGAGRTDGDTVVYFPGQKVVAVGDLYTPGTPDVEYAAGGSLVNWPKVLDEVLKLDFDVVVPSSGPAISRSDLEEFKHKLETRTSRAEQLVKRGVDKDKLMQLAHTDNLGR